MKRSTLLNKDLSYLIASLGHLDEIIIADASFTTPYDISVIDLALMSGVPSIFDVIHAVASELLVEKNDLYRRKTRSL